MAAHGATVIHENGFINPQLTKTGDDYMSLGTFRSITIITPHGFADAITPEILALIKSLKNRFSDEFDRHIASGFKTLPILRGEPDKVTDADMHDVKMWLKIDSTGSTVPPKLLVGQALKLSHDENLPVKLDNSPIIVVISPKDNEDTAWAKYEQKMEEYERKRPGAKRPSGSHSPKPGGRHHN